MSKTGANLRIVERIFDVLDCFSEERPEWGITELADYLGLYKSVVHRIVTCLVERGYFQQDPRTRRYRLGLKFLDFSSVILQQLDVRAVALPHMRELVQATNETALLTIVDGDEAVCIEKVESYQGVKCTSHVGKRLPLHVGAVTKILMSHLPEQQIERVIAKGLQQLTQYTVTDPVKLRAQLREVRHQDYAIAEQEVDLGSVGVAAPIRNHMGEVVAGLSLVAPMFRVTKERMPEIVLLVRRTAERISENLGYPAAGNELFGGRCAQRARTGQDSAQSRPPGT
ncbi:MAG: IclR family transcriptional regulator [Bacillota bacterium]